MALPQGAPQLGGPPPGMMPNPAFAAWQQEAQQVQAVMMENAKRKKQFDDAVQLIKSDGIRGFRLDIETDSTIAPDEQAEKQARIEFMQQFIPLMEQIIPQAMGNPAVASLAKDVTLFAVRGFRVARTLEESIEKAFDALAKMPPPPDKNAAKQGPQQNPQIEGAKIQADVHDTQVKAQTDQMAIAQKQQQAAMQAQIDMAKIEAENQRSQAQLGMQMADMASRERVASARVSHMAARDTQGLV